MLGNISFKDIFFWISKTITVVLLGLSLCACSPEEAEKAKIAAQTMRSAVDSAVSAYAALSARSIVGPSEPTIELRIADFATQEIARVKNRSNADTEEYNEQIERFKKDLITINASVQYKQAAQKEFINLTNILNAIEKATEDYAAAWPLGSCEFIKLKNQARALAMGLKQATLRFNQPEASNPGLNYVRLTNELRLATYALNTASAKGSLTLTIEQASRLRSIFLMEEDENVKIQAQFALASRAADDLRSAIEGVEKVSLGEMLRAASKALIKIVAIDSRADADRIAGELSIVLGKVDGSLWLSHLSNQNIDSVSFCK